MATRWIEQVARSIAAGEPKAVVEEYLDPLLLWLSNTQHPSVADLDQAIAKQGLNPAEARERAYRLLDRLIFADQGPPSPDLLCLPVDADANVAKRRYRRLMQVYHPDHHPTRCTWATARTERINRAFDAYRRGAKPRARLRAPGHRQPRTPHDLGNMVSARLGPVANWVGERIGWARQQLSGEQRLRNRLIVGVLSVAVLGLMVQAVTRDEPPRPARPVVQETIRVLPTLGRGPARPVATDQDDAELASTDWSDAGTEAANAEPTPIATMRKPEKAAAARPTVPAEATPKTESPAPETGRETASTAAASAPPATPPTPAATQAAPSADQLQTRPQLSAPPAWQPSMLGPPPAEPPVPLEPQQTIPPAASPRQPEPPKPPALPPQTAPTRLASPSGSSAGGISIDCRTAPGVLARFTQAYEAGALDDLMALYSPLARENDSATWFAIRQTYADWFTKTSMRRIAFDRLRVQPTAKGDRCAAMAVFQVNYVDAQSNLANQGGVIQFLFERRGPGLLILRVRY